MPSFKDIMRLATGQGWRVEKTQSSHWKFIPPDATKKIVVTGSTPSDHRSIKNFLADLKRQGFKLSEG